MSGLMIAAPHSGAGKTSVTLGLLRALRRRAIAAGSAKAGPDYIDPAFHAAASGAPCVNLDPWAMRPGLLAGLAAEARGTGGLVVEAMMGLFDGAADGSGSAADLAAGLDLKIVLVVDCARQSHSVAALVRGFASHREDIRIAGLILNRVGSPRHASLLTEALAPLRIPVLGVLPRQGDLALPERHLGLVQAGEHADLDAFLERASDWIEDGCDVAALAALAGGNDPERSHPPAPPLAPLGRHIAIARDAAFAFAYPHLMDGWRRAGAELSFFSPLADEAPDDRADAIYLPGGYPELHAGQIAKAGRFRAAMLAAAARGVAIYGECGGYMVLGEALTDAEGDTHSMLGLLPLRTSFRERRLHLGYRRLTPCGPGPWAGSLRAHEFHYTAIVSEGPGDPLFTAEDARGEALGDYGLRRGSVFGSFLHLIDAEA
ncbi:cobyrinate a,c-diamide synthase [Aurantimonas coralicida]|uniref:cobyrinate a,c-diamide synthase n=1 Tax=Aurantimonas coralicida TaxID=182270 RepID=UPI001E3BBCAB|nr:cobyrinate a,c-diamide synthase [Aurantimonas coralicida]MCD1645060.1 cobyrinate a,c-diamide synthase [Aurantimonas coralicida]